MATVWPNRQWTCLQNVLLLNWVQKEFVSIPSSKSKLIIYSEFVLMKIMYYLHSVNSSGGVKTNFFSVIGMNDQQIIEQEQILRKSSPLNLFGEPNDIADLTIFITSNDAKYMTGSNVLIDGGTLYSAINVIK